MLPQSIVVFHISQQVYTGGWKLEITKTEKEGLKQVLALQGMSESIHGYAGCLKESADEILP